MGKPTHPHRHRRKNVINRSKNDNNTMRKSQNGDELMKKNYKLKCQKCGKSPIRIKKGKDNKCLTCGALQTKKKSARERRIEAKE